MLEVMDIESYVRTSSPGDARLSTSMRDGGGDIANLLGYLGSGMVKAGSRVANVVNKGLSRVDQRGQQAERGAIWHDSRKLRRRQSKSQQ